MTGADLTGDLIRRVLPPVRFQGVSLEANDAATVARFWGVVLSAQVVDAGPGRYCIDPVPGRPTSEIIRITTAVPPRAEGKRVHLDVRLPNGPEHLLAAGARVLRAPGAEPWFVLADPEGNEFCGYPAVDDRPPGIFELVVKCRDAHAQAHWWGELLGGRVALEDEAAVVVGGPEFPWDFLLFDPVPEPKATRNRMHWHVTLRDPDPSDLVAAGATVLQKPTSRHDAWVLADPEGNEFCARPSA